LAYQSGSRLALAQDVEVWQHKRPCPNPMVIPGDGPFGKLRTWYKQFFEPRHKAEEYQKRVDGLVISIDKRAATEAA
jgi:3-ketosteroid 9alpha-monooxygenase subunit A